MSDIDLPNSERVQKWGHRLYVGGSDAEMWYGIGRRQYHFLVSQGLRPHHKFLDIACGSLRLGQYLIPMLDAGNYFGLEAEPELIEQGLANEILFDIQEIKKPTFASNYSFDLSFVESFDYAIAQSLFTHLTLDDIKACMSSVRSIAGPSSRFYFTFFEGDDANNPDRPSHPNLGWHYSFSTLRDAAADAGLSATYIGDWGHERDQKMAFVVPA